MADEPQRDGNRLLASLVHEQVSLDLRVVDLCFITALHLRALRTSAPSFDDETLCDVFEQVCDLADPGAENPRKRATNAIERLRKQRMLFRIDGVGVIRAGEYTLSRLASAIVEFFLAEDSLTTESLTILTRTLIAQLADVLAAARKASSLDDWRTGVAGPLRLAVSELIGGIERRQRGLDAQQALIKKQVAELLEEDWFRAVDQCEQLLDTTARTLRELHEILLRDTHEFQALLQDVQQLAAAAGASDTEDAVQRVSEQVDRIFAWGSTRQAAWSDYYQYINRYVRDVIRLDPDRALSQRLRDQLTRWPDAPFTLCVSTTIGHTGVRDVDAHFGRPPVSRPLEDRDHDPEDVEASNEAELFAEQIAAQIASGITSLSRLTARLLQKVEEEKRFVTVGRVAEVAGRISRVEVEHERRWESISDVVEIEEWSLRPKGKE